MRPIKDYVFIKSGTWCCSFFYQSAVYKYIFFVNNYTRSVKKSIIYGFVKKLKQKDGVKNES